MVNIEATKLNLINIITPVRNVTARKIIFTLNEYESGYSI